MNPLDIFLVRSLLTLLALSGCAATVEVKQKRLFSISSSPVRTKTSHHNLTSSSFLPQLVSVIDLQPYMVTLLFQVKITNIGQVQSWV